MIYLAKVEDFDEDFFAISLASLPLNLSERIEKIKKLQAKNQSILAWTILKSILNSEYSIKNFEIAYTKNSKPFFLENENIYFNLSHSYNYVACAVSNSEIGIDIQKTIEYKPKIAQRMFAQAEVEKIEKSDDKNIVFTKLWSIKESYLKFTGEGIYNSLKGLDFSNFLNRKEFEYMSLKFKTHFIDDYFISVCSENSDFEFEFIDKLKK